MKHLHSLLAFVILIFGQAARADLLVEPVIGYNFNTKVDFEGGENYSGGMGPAFGGRLGYQNLGLQLGVDYLSSVIDMDDNDFDDDVNLTEVGGFVGFKFPILLRAYAGYIFSATGDSKSANGDKMELSKGSGYKAGLGFTGLPFLNINVEYRSGTFDEVKVGTVELDEGATYQSIMLGLSLPISL
jgi:hypothetical protein